MCINSSGKDVYDEIRKAGRLKIIKRTEGVSATDTIGKLLLMNSTRDDY